MGLSIVSVRTYFFKNHRGQPLEWLLIVASVLFDSWSLGVIWFVLDCLKLSNWFLIDASIWFVPDCWNDLIGSWLLLAFCLVLDLGKKSDLFLIIWSYLIWFDCRKYLIGSWFLKEFDWLLLVASILFGSWLWQAVW